MQRGQAVEHSGADFHMTGEEQVEVAAHLFFAGVTSVGALAALAHGLYGTYSFLLLLIAGLVFNMFRSTQKPIKRSV